MNYFQEFYDWSEVWALLLPLIIYITKRPKQKYLQPIFLLILFMLCLYICADLIWKIKHFYKEGFEKSMPKFLLSNNFLYNIISVLRLLFFVWFFERLNFQPFQIKNSYIGCFALLMILFNFFLEPFNEFSSFTFSLESIILLTYSIAYFLFLIKSDELRTGFDAPLFIVTGIAIYEAANFFIFLFHKALLTESSQFAVAIWKLSNAYFIIFCLYLAKAFYGSTRKSILVPITST